MSWSSEIKDVEQYIGLRYYRVELKKEYREKQLSGSTDIQELRNRINMLDITLALAEKDNPEFFPAYVSSESDPGTM